MSLKFINRIKNYALASLLVPLVAINSCLLIYKFLGDVNPYASFDWKKEKIEHTYNEYNLIFNNFQTYTFVNCPKNKPLYYLSCVY